MQQRDLQHPKTDAQIAAEEAAKEQAILQRLAALEARVQKLEGKN